MKAKILTLLREAQGYVSGQEMCDALGVSRTAVWKVIGQLKKEGYPIEAVQNKGYHLCEEEKDSFYNEADLKSRMKSKWAGRELVFFSETDSTNTQAKLLAEKGAPHGQLVVADKQTGGKGRRGRVWESPAGSNIYFTLLLRPEIEPNTASMLTLVMAMAVAKGIEKNMPGLAKTGIKWPNDIIMNEKKVCGILTEMSLSVEQDSISYVVIGVGINVYNQEFPEEIAMKATGIETATGKKPSRSLLLADIMEAFEEYYECFLQYGNLEGLMAEYNERLVNVGRQVRVLDPKGAFEAKAEGINSQGELLVTLPDGAKQSIYAGEVSVRGTDGYV